MNKKLQKNKHGFYAENQIKDMRELLSNYWAENLDGEAVAAILLAGNEGYNNTDEETLIQEFESVFEKNFFGRD